MVLVRLQKYLSQCGVASRRHAEKLISSGEVLVNGKVVTTLGTKIDPGADVVQVEKRVLKPSVLGVALFHKPVKVVSTLSDPEGRPSVADYMTKQQRSYFPVGRLDFDSSGLVVMTNDGEMAEQLLHPRYGFQRVYEVEVKGWVGEAVLNRIEHGVKLEDGWLRVKVKGLKRTPDKTLLQISLGEGRNRVVRRLMEKIGYPVEKLKRISHGPFRLGNLKPGQIKKLSEKEYSFYKGRIARKAKV